MHLNIADIRKEYSRRKISIDEILNNPVDQFEVWLKDAIDANVPEPTAMCLSTVSHDGSPSSRMVLLKGIDQGRLYFYTNYNSRKGQDLESNPYCSLAFYWPEMERQVTIEGRTGKATAENSDEYFNTRPRLSRIGAWVSPQSQAISSKMSILRDFLKVSAKYIGRDVPRPPFWGGFEVTPQVFNFWQGRPNRLHDRIRYFLNSDQHWIKERIAP